MRGFGRCFRMLSVPTLTLWTMTTTLDGRGELQRLVTTNESPSNLSSLPGISGEPRSTSAMATSRELALTSSLRKESWSALIVRSTISLSSTLLTQRYRSDPALPRAYGSVRLRVIRMGSVQVVWHL